jgi:hypothetical protein
MQPDNVPSIPDQQPEQAPRIHSSIEAATSPGEHIIFKVRKHPFGLIVMYLQAILAFVIIAGLMYFLTPSVVSSGEEESVRGFVILGLVAFAILLCLILLIVTYIYSQNMLILTNRSITQVAQNGLFSRKVSELSLQNTEDITADKDGIWAQIFNFGVIKVETAGEQFNFHFQYCPNPNRYGQLILDSRQVCIQNNPPH